MSRLSALLLSLLTGFAAVNAECFAEERHHNISHISQNTENAAPFVIACNPEKPVVRRGETIRFYAWGGTPQGDLLREEIGYTWKVSDGQLSVSKTETTWTSNKSQTGKSVATVVGLSIRGGRSTCSMEIVVADPPKEDKSRTLTSDRIFLLPNKKESEDKHFGLYSYLLIYARPNGENLDRYLSIIDSFLDLVTSLNEQRSHKKRSLININYLPVTKEPPVELTIEKNRKALARWIIDNYDYQRGRDILSNVGSGHLEGPYFFSAHVPLTSTSTVPIHLWQDLSRVPPQLGRSWVKAFLNQAAQQKYWEEPGFHNFYIKVRTAISVLSAALPESVKSLETIFKYVQSPLQLNSTSGPATR